MAILKIPHRIVKIIHERVSNLFDGLKARFLGPASGKTLTIKYNRSLSLPGMYESALVESGGLPNLETLSTLTESSKNHLDALKLKSINTIVNEVEKHLNEADNPTPASINSVLQDSWEKVTDNVKAVVDSETQTIKNYGSMEGVVRANASVGIDDPYIVFITAKDNIVCDECTRLHLMPDGITPRVWRLSEVMHGYIKKGSPVPSVHGAHVHCRCVISTLLPDFGFDEKGRLTYISRGHKEYAKQRGEE